MKNKCSPQSLSSYCLISHTSKTQSWFVFSLRNVLSAIWCCCYMSLPPSSCGYYERPHTTVSISPPSLSVPVSLSLALALSCSLSLRLSGCPSGRMSTIDLYRQHFSNDGGLWVVPNRIQQTGDQVSDRLAGICEEEEKWQYSIIARLQSTLYGKFPFNGVMKHEKRDKPVFVRRNNWIEYWLVLVYRFPFTVCRN